MFTLRCTHKLLRRGLAETSGPEHAPTTLLGDWYANVLFCRPQHLVLCISERTLLPIVVPAKDTKLLLARVHEAVSSTLATIGIPPSVIAAELGEMQAFRIGRTLSKRILGSLNDFMFHLEHALHEHPTLPLFEHALRLADIPCKPIEYSFPSEATKALFLSAPASSQAREKNAL